MRVVGTFNGVDYYDDSASIAPESSIQAITSIEGPKVLIAGGADSGHDLANLAEVVEASGVIHVFLTGEIADRLAEALQAVGFGHYTLVPGKGIDTLVATCRHITEPGDAVLLSPGTVTQEPADELGAGFAAAVKALT